MALNVLVFVGKSLYQRCLTTDEVCHELKLRNIDLSPSEIEYLGRKFILGQLRKTLQKHAATTRLGEIIRDLHRRIANNALDAGHLTAAITKGHALENMNLASLASILVFLFDNVGLILNKIIRVRALR